MQQPLLESVVLLAVGFVITFALTPFVASFMKRRGVVGVDVHKVEHPSVPEMGGIAILIGLITAVVVGSTVLGTDPVLSAAFLGTVLIAGLVGLADDIRPLSPKLKPVLTAVACVPILALGAFTPRPELPFIGATRLTLIYPLLIPLAVAVPANAVNMLDVVNGATTGTVSVILLAIALALFASGNYDVAALSFALLGCLIAFHWFNRYPSRIFGGDTGSLAIGAAVGALAVIGRVEVVAIVALIPHIMNAFYGLSSVGRLYERREVHERPTKILPDGKMDASKDSKAPLTLLRLILAEGALSELQVFRTLVALSAFSSLLGLVTFLLVRSGFV